MRIYFWHLMVSPHRTALCEELACLGFEVVYIASELLSEERKALGWTTERLNNVDLRLVEGVAEAEEIVNRAAATDVHIVQGVRANGYVGAVLTALINRKAKVFVAMETVDCKGPTGLLKWLVYRAIFARYIGSLAGVLATGKETSSWLRGLGIPEGKIFPFAYFLSESGANDLSEGAVDRPSVYTFMFAGNFIKRKRVDLLFKALEGLDSLREYRITMVGSGPLEESLKQEALVGVGDRVTWKGVMSPEDVRSEMAGVDCLVLPSSFDGWGAVVSEALMVGTPAVASTRCGSSEVVDASGVGGVFKSESVVALKGELERLLIRGKVSVTDRRDIKAWGRCLGAKAGAKYLVEIIAYSRGGPIRPVPPWKHPNV